MDWIETQSGYKTILDGETLTIGKTKKTDKLYICCRGYFVKDPAALDFKTVEEIKKYIEENP